MAENEDKAPAPKGATAKSKTKTAAERASGDANVSPAGPDSMNASGAIMEPDALQSVDVDHPAVDNNPREGTTVRQNQIDFNDPGKKDEEAVRDNLSK